jgi:hypothetical protein
MTYSFWFGLYVSIFVVLAIVMPFAKKKEKSNLTPRGIRSAALESKLKEMYTRAGLELLQREPCDQVYYLGRAGYPRQFTMYYGDRQELFEQVSETVMVDAFEYIGELEDNPLLPNVRQVWYFHLSNGVFADGKHPGDIW